MAIEQACKMNGNGMWENQWKGMNAQIFMYDE